MIIFFIHKGVLLTQEPEFQELIGQAKYAVCNVGFEAQGLKGKTVPGMPRNRFRHPGPARRDDRRLDRYLVM